MIGDSLLERILASTTMSTDCGRSVHFSDEFVISCGTVSVDTTRAKVLLIRWRKTGEILLPKGRKNIDESLQQAAIRETFEETGYQASLLPLEFPTLATSASDRQRAITEPIAVTQRNAGRKLKIIFWFAAEVDLEKPREKGTQQEGEDFEPIWLDVADAIPSLTFEDDKDIVKKVILAACHV